MTDQKTEQKPEQKTDQGFGRRDFLKSAVVGGAAAVAGIQEPQAAHAQQPAAAAAAAPAAAQAPAYEFLNLEEAAFVEALVDHMVPADHLSPKGSDLGVNIYIDRALAGAWGKGDRLYLQGPWKQGVPNQGYQLPLTPAELYRAGIAATNAHCRKTFGKALTSSTRRSASRCWSASRPPRSPSTTACRCAPSGARSTRP
jgi:gluconate 2-dehydrogenase gamma chain